MGEKVTLAQTNLKKQEAILFALKHKDPTIVPSLTRLFIFFILKG